MQMQKIVLQHWWNCLVILIKNEIYFLRAYSAVLKVMDCSIIWWIFFHRFYFNYFFGVAGRFNIQHPSSTFNSDSHSDQLFSSHLIRVTTLAPTPQTMKMRCPNIFAISPINSPLQAPHALCVAQPPIPAITVWHFISSDVGIFLCVELH